MHVLMSVKEGEVTVRERERERERRKMGGGGGYTCLLAQSVESSFPVGNH